MDFIMTFIISNKITEVMTAGKAILAISSLVYTEDLNNTKYKTKLN